MGTDRDRSPALPADLQLRPPSSRSRGWLYVLALALPLVIVGVTGGLLLSGAQAQSRSPETVIGLVVATLFIAAVAATLSRLMSRHRLSIDSDAIDVRTSFYHRRIPLTSLQLQRARVVDLAERTELRPFLKTNGFALPGYHSGWFRLRNRSRAFCAISDGARVLWLPTSESFDVLLQPGSPQALLDHLRGIADGEGKR